MTKVTENSYSLEKLGKCFTGEIDLTINKNLLSLSTSDAVLIKGAQVQKYNLLQTMSQGEIMHLNKSAYQKFTRGVRSSHYLTRRIVMQGITGINEVIRLKLTIIEPPTFCANSVNYILMKKEDFNLEFMLGILNSRLINWYFKTMSTNSNVNGYEVDHLPIRLANENVQADISSLVKKILIDKNTGDDTSNHEDEINHMVYDLYNLTKEEKYLIENSGK